MPPTGRALKEPVGIGIVPKGAVVDASACLVRSSATRQPLSALGWEICIFSWTHPGIGDAE